MNLDLPKEIIKLLAIEAQNIRLFKAHNSAVYLQRARDCRAEIDARYWSSSIIQAVV